MKHKKFLFFLFFISFLIRAIVFECFLRKNKHYFRYDSRRYYEVATQIAQGNGIKNADGSFAFWRVPGYSLFLGFFYWLFDQNIAIWIQIFLASFLPVLIFFLSLTFFPANILLAKVASVYSAFHLGYILFSSFMMTETLFCLFFFLFLIFFFKPFCYKNIFWSGFCLGFASMFRPVGQYVIVVAMLMLLCLRSSFVQKLKASGVLFFSWFFIVFWWLLRNYLLTGYFFLHTMTGAHLLFYVATPIDSQVKNIAPLQASDRIMIDERGALFAKAEQEKGRPLFEIEKCDISEKLALGYVKQHPFVAIKNAMYNSIKTCISLYSSEVLAILGYYPPLCYEQGRTFWGLIKRFLFPPVQNLFVKIIIFLEIIFLLSVLFGCFLFFIASFFNKNLLWIMLKVFPIVGLMIALSCATGFARLRLPIEPFLIIFGIYGYMQTIFCKCWR